MKKCPICDVALEREVYEGFPIDSCPSCSGCLVRQSGVEGIKRTRQVDSAELVAEAQTFESSTQGDVTCPACFRMMEKCTTLGFPKVEFDCCDGCTSIWFDPGELAMLQLTYEASSKGLAQTDMRARAEDFENSPERKRRFEENLAKCSNESYSAMEAVTGGIFDGIIAGIFSAGGVRRWRL